jgi:hypothetical protein
MSFPKCNLEPKLHKFIRFLELSGWHMLEQNWASPYQYTVHSITILNLNAISYALASSIMQHTFYFKMSLVSKRHARREHGCRNKKIAWVKRGRTFLNKDNMQWWHVNILTWTHAVRWFLSSNSFLMMAL